MHMNNNKNKFILLGVVVLVVAAAVAGGAWWWMGNREVVSEIEPGDTLVAAQGSNMVSGFPKELILEKDVVISDSYRVDYSRSGATQPVAVYDSNLNLEANLTAFRAYFAENGWELQREGDVAQTPVTFIFATKGDNSVNATFESLADGKVRVSIAYLAIAKK
jgi:hypothetical protein